MVNSLVEHLSTVPGPLVLAIVGLLVFGEAAFFLGFVLPGETAVLLGGFMAYNDRISLSALFVVVVACAVVGDSVGYEVGRRLGPRILSWRLLARHEHRLDGARRFLDGRGGFAVFLGRFTAFLRAVMPGLAGMAQMRYRRFLAFNAIGGLVWGGGCVIAGYAAGKSYEQVGQWMGRSGAIVLAVLVVGALFVWHRRREHTAELDAAADAGTLEP